MRFFLTLQNGCVDNHKTVRNLKSNIKIILFAFSMKKCFNLTQFQLVLAILATTTIQMAISSAAHSLTHIMTHCPTLTHIRAQHNISSPLDLWHSPVNCLLFLRGAGLLGQTSWGTTTTTTTFAIANVDSSSNLFYTLIHFNRSKISIDRQVDLK